MSTAPTRRRRADAERNLTALLDAARVVFMSTGVDAPAKEITDLAGVGVGTLYRHFPRRSDLVIAVLENEIDKCAAAAVELSAELAPWEALTEWVDRFTDFVGTKRGLAAALLSGDPAFDGLPRMLLGRLEPAADELLAAARQTGVVRASISGSELMIAVALLCQPVPGEDQEYNERMVRLIVAGLSQPN